MVYTNFTNTLAMNDVFMIIALGILGITLAVALSTDNSWKSVAITWLLLAVGCVFFGIALTL